MPHSKPWWSIVLILGLLVVGAPAQETTQPVEKHDLSSLDNTLRDVINAGAKIFNEHGDHAGCYRLYQGSLLSIKPFLPPDLQKTVSAGLASAEKQGSYADRAFELRRVLDAIRAKAKSGGTSTKSGDGDKGQV